MPKIPYTILRSESLVAPPIGNLGGALESVGPQEVKIEEAMKYPDKPIKFNPSQLPIFATGEKKRPLLFLIFLIFIIISAIALIVYMIIKNSAPAGI